MKLAYERPVMRAEMFQTNAYCASACDTTGTNALIGINFTLGNAFKWFKVPRADTSYRFWEETAEDSSLADLTFGGAQRPMAGTGNTPQFYWTATQGDKTYHLEYSAGWTEKWENRSNTERQDGDMVFVLYEEITGNNTLEACVDGYHSEGGSFEFFPGSDGDNDWIGTGHYDDSMYQFVARADATGLYWST